MAIVIGPASSLCRGRQRTPPWPPLLPSSLGCFFLFLALLLLVFIQPCSTLTRGIVLDDFVQHFEPLFYDRHDVVQQHGRTKRETHPELRLQFTAHNRLFKIRLRRSTSVFAKDAFLESSRGPIAFDLDRIYQGQLEDDDQSTVEGIITSSGHLDATISTVSEDYYIEPAERYFGRESNVSFPGVIYKSSDVLRPESPDGGCASHGFYLKQLEHSWNCANRLRVNNQSSSTVIHSCSYHQHDSQEIPSSGRRRSNAKWTVKVAANQVIDRTLYSGWNRHNNRSKKRRSTIDPKKTACMLYLQADHLFYNKMGSEEACIETMTRHVQRVNAIYKNIDFDGDGQPDEINFMIKRIKVYTERALNDPAYRFPGNYGVEKFLELFSEEDYDAFCLAYMFTYRDFEGGTLGLAWTGDLKNAGGVCEKNGHYRGSLKSLNTGIVTLLNYGKHVPPAVSHVTLAHEIGHNFGSPHDPENNRECTPGGEDGNYIMFARATSGDKKNNNKFSPCSLKSINGVLNAKARDSKGCFTEPQSAICGNGVVESGEECDCGWEEDCKEKCCYPMRSSPIPGEEPCTLRPFKLCSPSQGPCCTDDCRLRREVKCRDDNGCRDAAYCDGTGPRCPPSNNKPNKTVCNEEFVCFMGECTGSICIAYGLQSCQCIQGPNDPPTKACELCCKLPGDDQPCLSSFEWNTSPYDVPDMHAKPGTPCNNYNGYCDVFQRCREVDPSGPLATLRRLLLSDESIASLKKWVEDHWYGVLFIAVGFITLIVAIARVFGKRAKLKLRRHRNPSRQVNGNVTTATAAVTGENHIVHPVAVRTKIPLKTKVREKRKRTKKTSNPSAKTPSKAVTKLKSSRSLFLFSKPAKKHDGSRQRRTGLVNTTEKVQSWLERENPHQTVHSDDNESHFPEDRAVVNNSSMSAQVLGRHSHSLVDVQHSRNVTDKIPDLNRASRTSAKRTSVDNLTRKTNSYEELTAMNSNTDIITASSMSLVVKASSTDILAGMNQPSQPSGIQNSKSTGSKMMRSISECHGPYRQDSRYRFARSVSHTHEPDFKRLQRSSKTESSCHLLSKSELDVNSKSSEMDNCIQMEQQLISPVVNLESHHKRVSQQDLLNPKQESAQATTHVKRIPKPRIPKSATDGKIKAMTKPRKKFASFEFLNSVARRSGKVKDADAVHSAPTAAASGKRIQGSSSGLKAKAVGLGPVRIVLKWHGTSRSKPKKNKTSKDKKPPRKRVIVYKNGNLATGMPSENFQEAMKSEPEPTRRKSEIKSESKPELVESRPKMNIVTNPLEELQEARHVNKETVQQVRRDSVSFKTRRFSVQERVSHPPKLNRNLSEVHPPNLNGLDQRRNRHSWSSSRPHHLPTPSLEHINIEIDSDQADC